MFKSGEIAGIKGSGETVVVQKTLSIPLGLSTGFIEWPVITNGGTYNETDLFVARPEVLATAQARTLPSEHRRQWLRDLDKDDFLPRDLLEEVKKIIGKASFDWLGHWRNGTRIGESMDRVRDHLFIRLYTMNKAHAEELVRAGQSEAPLDQWIPLPGGSLCVHDDCYLCGEGDFELETNGQVIRLVGKPCEYPEGLPLTEWELNVPSGKLVVANNLLEIFPLPEGDEFNVNMAIEKRRSSLTYAANGLAFGAVGNTCPSVYRCKDGTYKIANEPHDDDDTKPVFEGERVAHISTTLWWYSICDHDEFVRRCERFGADADDFEIDVVDVVPGVYRFRHDDRARDGYGEIVHARFERVRDPDPVKDFIALYENVEINPNALVQAKVERWPTLYGKVLSDHPANWELPVPWSEMGEEDRIRSWQRVADQVFCTLGGGIEWHEKGFPLSTVDPSVPDVEPPAFRKQYNWYPFSERYAALLTMGSLSPSFAKLAFRVLESIISFGTRVSSHGETRDVVHVRERMILAVKRYRELAKQYPDLADPDYVAWLSQEGRAEAWVANFNLGPERVEKEEVRSEVAKLLAELMEKKK